MVAAHRVVMDTLHVRLGLTQDPTFLIIFRHHSPSSSIVDEFNSEEKLIDYSNIPNGSLESVQRTCACIPLFLFRAKR